MLCLLAVTHRSNILDIPRAWFMVPDVALEGFWHISFYKFGLGYRYMLEFLPCAQLISRREDLFHFNLKWRIRTSSQVWEIQQV